MVISILDRMSSKSSKWCQTQFFDPLSWIYWSPQLRKEPHCATNFEGNLLSSTRRMLKEVQGEKEEPARVVKWLVHFMTATSTMSTWESVRHIFHEEDLSESLFSFNVYPIGKWKSKYWKCLVPESFHSLNIEFMSNSSHISATNQKSLSLEFTRCFWR